MALTKVVNGQRQPLTAAEAAATAALQAGGQPLAEHTQQIKQAVADYIADKLNGRSITKLIAAAINTDSPRHAKALKLIAWYNRVNDSLDDYLEQVNDSNRQTPANFINQVIEQTNK